MTYQGFFWGDWNEGSKPMLTSKLHVLSFISASCHDRFSWNFYSMDSFDGTIITEGKQAYPNYQNWLILMDFYAIAIMTRDSFDDMIEMRGNKPMLTSKLHVKYLVKYHQLLWQGFFWWDDFHANFKTVEFYITGIDFDEMITGKWGRQSTLC